MSILSDDFPMSLEREAGMPEQVPSVAVSFGMYPKKDGKASADAGRDIYKDVEFVKIAIPGDKHSLVFQPATDVHRKRFPKAYEAFQRRAHTPMQGTPIEQWPVVSRSIVLNLKALHVHTVEALAEVHDGNIDRLGSQGRELRAKAKAWLAEAQTGAEATRLAAEKQALQDQLAALQAQMADLQRQMNEQGEQDEGGTEGGYPLTPPKRRGRPPNPHQDTLPRN